MRAILEETVGILLAQRNPNLLVQNKLAAAHLQDSAHTEEEKPKILRRLSGWPKDCDKLLG